MATKINIRTLLEAGCHFGHQTRRWNPKMKPFIFGERNGIYILDLKQTILDARIAYGVAGPVPMRAPSAEAAAKGQPVCAETVAAFGKAALDDVNPRTSWRASRELRLQLVEELAKRCLTEAIQRSGGDL